MQPVLQGELSASFLSILALQAMGWRSEWGFEILEDDYALIIVMGG